MKKIIVIIFSIILALIAVIVILSEINKNTNDLNTKNPIVLIK